MQCYVCGTETDKVLKIRGKNADGDIEVVPFSALCMAEECMTTMGDKLGRWGFETAKRLAAVSK